MIGKIISKIRASLNISEADAQKILAGLAILGIAISWFVLGIFLNTEVKISKEEIEQENMAHQFAEEANQDFKK